MTVPSRPTLRREIVSWYSVVLLASLGVFTLLTYLLLAQALERAGRATLRQTAQLAEQLAVPSGIPAIATQERLVHLQAPTGEAQTVEVLHRRTELATGAVVEAYVVRNEDAEQHALRTFLVISLLLIPLTAAAAALGGRALLERVLEPLGRLVTATREIGIGGLSRRVHEPDRPAELGELARSFNDMLMRLERAVKALRNFTGDASHELRTPLTSIKGTIQVALQRERTAPELQDTLEVVLEETERMLHLVDDLLVLARGEETAGLPERRAVDLSELLEEVMEVAQALAVEKPVRLESHVPGGLSVTGSPGQLRQVFLNLISNAVRFTEEGSITLEARRLETPEGEGVEVAVTDTGIGIAPEELPRIFDRFYRGDAARGRTGGTGLGLAIARLLVELHGGTIRVTSEPGRGSRFVVTLPAASETRP